MSRTPIRPNASVRTFGPGYPVCVEWYIEHKNGTYRWGTGKTAFEACQSIGWSLGEIDKIAPPAD